jgi:hypothetical protein
MTFVRARLAPIAPITVPVADCFPCLQAVSSRSVNFQKKMAGSTMKFILSDDVNVDAAKTGMTLTLSISVDGGSCEATYARSYKSAGALHMEVLLPSLMEGEHNVALCAQSSTTDVVLSGQTSFIEVTETLPLD